MATINGETAMEKTLGSIGSFSNNNNKKEVFLRADKIDFKSWDLQLDKHLSRAWSRGSDGSTLTKKEEWEIDLAKLDIRYVIAYGTYGTVYRGVYDTQDVAVKVLDWGEDGIATVAEAAALRASFRQEVAVWHKLDHPNVTKFIGASMGTSNLKIPTKDGISENNNSLPARACCVVVEYLPGGTLKNFLIRNRRKKLTFKVVIQIALDLSRGLTSASDTFDCNDIGDCYLQNLRPEIPRCCPSSLASIMRKCWDAHPERRPDMDEVVRLLEAVDTSKGGGMIPDDQARGCFCFTARGP
ncbi:hypothetical protein Goarm_010871 [Gossypium armourianum]|uniref:Protein kinase domain-containing protein n=1 Tax=Gossypium armourianum TaxID=34283 RepID=A0A7J9IV22_9ROSI|nr:hypothetical protein [Gossypium armourianum]